jgi:hypothetical protein
MPNPWEVHRQKYGCQCDRSTGSCQKPKKSKDELALAGAPPDVLEKLGQAIAMGVVAGMKAAEVEKNREKNEQRERQRRRTRDQMNENRVADIRKWRNCSHMRSHPYSGTSRIAWATQSDGVTRGTCMGCGCFFSPIDSELADPAAMKGWYQRMIAIPQTVAANDFLTGTVMTGSPA